MAFVDSLLKLVAVRGAEALVLENGAVPLLVKGGEELPLRMPPPSSAMFETMLDSITNDAERARLSQHGSVQAIYRAADDTGFAAELRQLAGGVVRVSFRPEAAGEAPEHDQRRVEPVTGASSKSNLYGYLQQATISNASDLFISSDMPARMRVVDSLRPLSGPIVTVDDIRAFFEPFLQADDRESFDRAGSCDVAISTPDGARYRSNLFKQERGLAATFRPIRSDPPTLAGLNLPADLHQLTRYRSGLVLMVGTTGSGKSTTLAALIEHLNRTADKHIITIEDPIEFVYQPRQCLIHQREVGRHVSDFSTGLRAALRESPDVILLGEMRDLETIAAALTAAETGHLVLSTLHSGSGPMAIDRIIDVFPQHQQQQVRYQLSDVLRAVVTQHLLPSTQAGLSVPAYEKLNVTRAVSTKIREQRTHQIETELQKGRAEGMVPLALSLARLVNKGLVKRETAHEIASDGIYLDQLIRDMSSAR